MGVDYDAVFGIGVEVDYINDGDEETDLREKLENLDYKDLYEYGEAGDSGYSGRNPEYFIFIKDPFKDGYDITEKVWDFYEWLNENKVIHKSNKERVDICGDLRIW